MAFRLAMLYLCQIISSNNSCGVTSFITSTSSNVKHLLVVWSDTIRLESSKIGIFILAFWYGYMMWTCPRKSCRSLFTLGLLWQHSKCAESPIYQLFPYSNFGHACHKVKFVLISCLTANAQHKIKQNLHNSSLWLCSHIMAILKSQNKNTDIWWFWHNCVDANQYEKKKRFN